MVGCSAVKKSCALEGSDGGGGVTVEDIGSRGVMEHEKFQAEKIFSAGERYLAGVGAGAKRTSAHGRLLRVGGEK